jgi:sugar/nucleoside kinase (ribokinase family)
MNLSAKWVVQGFLKCLLELLPYADYVFGNEDEARCLAKEMKWREVHCVKRIACNIAMLPKLDPSKPRCVVITQGADDVVMVVARLDTDVSGATLDKEQITPMGPGCFTANYDDGCNEREKEDKKEEKKECKDCARCETFVLPTYIRNRISITSIPVTPIPTSELKDTNGCGDSFVGAFLATVSQGKSHEEAAKAGNALAQLVARATGCVFPKEHTPLL